MASASSSVAIKEDVKCPICMEYLTDPVTLDCGHNFCRGCISMYCETWEDLEEVLECPLCKAKIKRGNFRPNWQLASIAENIKCLSLNREKEELCLKHKEKLHLFCKEHQELVCLICERSPEHQSHTVLLLEEAAKECKLRLCRRLEVLKKERNRILENTTGTENESRALLGQIEETNSRTVAAFNQLQQFLETQKAVLLSQLEELQNEIVIRTEQHMSRLKEKLFSLEGLIQQMEEKSQQLASELLKDIRGTLERYKKKKAYQTPVAFPPVLTSRIRDFLDVRPFLESVMNQFPASAANVTLDPDTAHPELIVSKDLKSVRLGERQAVHESPKRFDYILGVLSNEGFTAGRHFWEVTVGSEEEWAVGVARNSVKRKGEFYLSPEEGIWALGKLLCYRVYTAPRSTPLTHSQLVKRIRVTLDCAEGQVSFSDADTRVHLYTFSGVSSYGDTLLPFFLVAGEALLKLSA